MKILFVTQLELDTPFGGPRHVLALARCWAEQGHEVMLMAPGADPEVEGVERIRTQHPPGLRLELLQAGAIARLLCRRRPDIAYLRLTATTSAVPLFLKQAGLPFLTELNGPLLDELRQLGRSRWAVQVVAMAEQRVSRWAEALIAVDPNTAHHAQARLGATEVRLIENGADLEVAVPGARSVARARLGLDPEATILGFAGNLAHELRFDILVEAVSTLEPEPLVLIAGDGPARPTLETLVRGKPNFHLLGSVPHQHAIDVLRASDVCINVRDGMLGMKVLEYAALGRRFISFKVAGAHRLEQIYPKHRVAFFVEERTAPAFGDAIAAAIEQEARGPVPADAIEAARSQIGWDRTARRIVEVFEEVLRREAGRQQS